MKRERYYTEEQKEIQRFVKILVGLIIIILGFYLLTQKLNNKSVYKRTDNKGSIQYSYIYLGTILNLSDSEYYVLAVDSQDVNNTYLLNEASMYRQKNNKIPLYYADLSFEFNKPFKADNSNYNETNINELKLKKTTLIKVKNGKITQFVEKDEEIESLLK